jgi:GAF domain-containing protein
MNGTLVKGTGVLVAGIAALALVLAVPFLARATSRTGQSRRQQSDAAPTLRQDPYFFRQPNPLGLRSLASTEQFAEEGDPHNNSSEIDAEVGAGDHDVLTTPVAATRPPAGNGWVEQAVITAVVLAVLAVSLRLIFMPGDRIPRIGPRPSSSEK